MKLIRTLAFATVTLLALLGLTPHSVAASVTATVTADNHYALYYGTDSKLTYVGRNEKGSAGNPGAYNWVAAETYSGLPLAETDRLYIVQWDECSNCASTFQALLGQFITSDGGKLFTNSSEWTYFLTSEPNPGLYGDSPSADALEAMIVGATWSQPGYSTPNGTGTWAFWGYGAPDGIPGISTQADWIARTKADDSSYFLTVYRSIPFSAIQGRDIVETPVPEPKPLALLACGIGMLLAMQRRVLKR